MKKIAAMLVLAMLPGLAAAGLCPKCADKVFIQNIGTCTACGGTTSSGSFKLCAACSAKQGKCQACGASLAAVAAGDEKSPATNQGPKAPLQAVGMELQAPSPNWTVALDGVYHVGKEVWAVWQLDHMEGTALAVIANLKVTVYIAPTDLPVKHFVLGKGWNWGNDGPYVFVAASAEKEFKKNLAANGKNLPWSDTPDALPATEAELTSVKRTLSTVRAGSPESITKATAVLVARGQPIVQALKQALRDANETEQKVIMAALIELAWKQQDVPKLLLTWAQAKNKGLASIPDPAPLTNDWTTAILPGHRFYLVAYPMFPVQTAPQAPLIRRQIFIVSCTGHVTHAPGIDALRAFFIEYLPRVKDEKDARITTAAWLHVAKELASDGWYKFTIDPEAVKVVKKSDGLESTGKAAVVTAAETVDSAGTPRGNQGAVAVTIAFDEEGRIRNINQDHHLRPGMRPICQSTKLLDPDPIVRKMAEQDLLLMGTAAREYLANQRAKASPELQKAIDAIWQRILDRQREDQNVDPRLK